jgi:hypothetical protein
MYPFFTAPREACNTFFCQQSAFTVLRLTICIQISHNLFSVSVSLCLSVSLSPSLSLPLSLLLSLSFSSDSKYVRVLQILTPRCLSRDRQSLFIISTSRCISWDTEFLFRILTICSLSLSLFLFRLKICTSTSNSHTPMSLMRYTISVCNLHIPVCFWDKKFFNLLPLSRSLSFSSDSKYVRICWPLVCLKLWKGHSGTCEF